MDIQVFLDEMELGNLAKKAHFGDNEAINEYGEMIAEASRSGDKQRLLFLHYVREIILAELLTEYLDGFGQYAEQLESALDND